MTLGKAAAPELVENCLCSASAVLSAQYRPLPLARASFLYPALSSFTWFGLTHHSWLQELVGDPGLAIQHMPFPWFGAGGGGQGSPVRVTPRT